MTTKLEQAARALLAHWDTPAWKYLKPTGDLMADLRKALAVSEQRTEEQAEQEPVAIDWEPLQNFWRNNSSVDWEELEFAVKCAVAASVRAKDLTDDEIEKAVENIIFDENFDINIARAVIAADREKNK